MVSINSYNYINLLLGYGPKKEVICNIYWSAQSHGFRLIFMGGITTVNAHSMMRDQLATHLNSQHSLAQMVCILHETYYPLSSIAKLPIIPHLGIPVIISKCFNGRKLNYRIFFTASSSSGFIVLYFAAVSLSHSFGLPSYVLPGDSLQIGSFGIYTRWCL